MLTGRHALLATHAPTGLVVLAMTGMLSMGSGCGWSSGSSRRGGPLPLPARQNTLAPTPHGADPDTAPPALVPAEDGDGNASLKVPSPEGGGWRTVRWDKQSRSIGKPNGGKLVGGRALPPRGEGWRCIDGDVYGTDETLLLVTWAIASVQMRFPGTCPILIGDISREGGGKLRPHRSHQSGRDIDIGYYALENCPLRSFRRMDEANLDTEKTWLLLESLLLSRQIRFIFIDYRLQPLLFDAALDAGWDEASLAEIFQYPRGRGSRKGLIRHSSGHDDHFHVRFRCPRGDADCVE